MISYDLFKKIDDFLYKYKDLSDEDKQAYVDGLTNKNLITNKCFSRGGKYYTTLETNFGIFSLTKSKIELASRIAELAKLFSQLDKNNRRVMDWFSHLCYCNNIKYKLLNDKEIDKSSL